MKTTALKEIHEAAGAKMVDFAGFYMPVQYKGIIDEHLSVRKSVGMFDVSHMGVFKVQGPQALNFLQKVYSNDLTKIQVGQAQYGYFPNENGGVIDDLLIYQLAADSYMCVVNAGNIDKDWKWLQDNNTEQAELINESDDTAILAIQGPNAKATLQTLTKVDLESIPNYHFEVGQFAGVDNVVISATGYTGLGGFELYFDKKYSEEVWTKIMEAGAAHDIQPIGLGARDTLRLEKGFCLYGNDIDDNTSPIEAGLAWVTKFNKDFVAKDIIQAQKEQGAQQKLVGFVMVEKGIPRKDYSIADAEGNVIGRVTSGTQSPTLSKGIGMGYVNKEKAVKGSEIFIVRRNKLIKAEVVRTPFV